MQLCSLHRVASTLHAGAASARCMADGMALPRSASRCRARTHPLLVIKGVEEPIDFDACHDEPERDHEAVEEQPRDDARAGLVHAHQGGLHCMRARGSEEARGCSQGASQGRAWRVAMAMLSGSVGTMHHGYIMGAAAQAVHVRRVCATRAGLCMSRTCGHSLD